MDELIEQIGRGTLTFVRRNAFWFLVIVPVLVVAFLPMSVPPPIVVIALIYLAEAIAYAILRWRASR